MYRTILFDFDGTVFNTGEGVTKSVQYAARAFGFVADDLDELRCFIGPPLYDTLKEKFGVDDDTAAGMLAKYRERYSKVGIRECFPYPGVAELARSLRAAGKNVAVATGKPTVFTNEIIAAHGMEDCFEAVLGCELDGRRSQKWEVISELLERFGTDGAVMIGDRDNDVLGAAKCNIPCIGVAYGYAEPGELESAGAISIARDVHELIDILFADKD